MSGRLRRQQSKWSISYVHMLIFGTLSSLVLLRNNPKHVKPRAPREGAGAASSRDGFPPDVEWFGWKSLLGIFDGDIEVYVVADCCLKRTIWHRLRRKSAQRRSGYN